MYPPLSSLYKILDWHFNDRDHPPGESLGVFSVLPEEISSQFPAEGKEGHDNSPPHVTVCYIGTVPLVWENKIVTVTEAICGKFRPFTVKLGKPKVFINHKNETIYHSPIKGNKLYEFHDELKRALQLNLIPVDTKHPDYKPHVTIEYVEEGNQRRFPEACPQGEWQMDSVWIWGGHEPHLIHIGKNK